MKVKLNLQRLQLEMNKKSWSEKELASAMGVSNVTVWRVLNGERGIGNEFIARLKKAMSDTQFEELFIIED